MNEGTMNCLSKMKEGAELLLDYGAGTLTSARKVEIDRHIENCTECRGLVEAQRDMWHTLDQWTPPAVAPDFDRRLYARIAEEKAAPLWSRWMRRLFQPAIPVPFWKPAVSLAGACAVLAVGLMVHAPNAGGPAKQIHAVNVHADNVDIEQVANTLDDLELLTPTSSSPM
jgi:anti-sigma-K factor RskA